MEHWNIVNEVGNPKEEGLYPAVIIFNEVEHHPEKESDACDGWIPTGKRKAFVDTRYFCDAKKRDLEAWIMKDQPKEGLVWTEESGSAYGESVYAWLPGPRYPNIKLPDGVEWEK